MSHHKHSECCDHDSCCSDEKCCDNACTCCGHHHNKNEECCHEDFAKHLLNMADCAWMELLKEKIKQQIASSCGEQLDQIAKIVSESNSARWEHKLSIMKTQNEYKDKLKNIFSCGSNSCKK